MDKGLIIAHVDRKTKQAWGGGGGGGGGSGGVGGSGSSDSVSSSRGSSTARDNNSPFELQIKMKQILFL